MSDDYQWEPQAPVETEEVVAEVPQPEQEAPARLHFDDWGNEKLRSLQGKNTSALGAFEIECYSNGLLLATNDEFEARFNEFLHRVP